MCFAASSTSRSNSLAIAAVPLRSDLLVVLAVARRTYVAQQSCERGLPVAEFSPLVSKATRGEVGASLHNHLRHKSWNPPCSVSGAGTHAYTCRPALDETLCAGARIHHDLVRGPSRKHRHVDSNPPRLDAPRRCLRSRRREAWRLPREPRRRHCDVGRLLADGHEDHRVGGLAEGTRAPPARDASQATALRRASLLHVGWVGQAGNPPGTP
jgi:hypothetical protein